MHRQDIAMPSPFIGLPSRLSNARVPLVRPWRLLPGPGEPPYPRLQGSGPCIPEEQTINICRPFGLPNLGGPSDLGCCRHRGVHMRGSSTQGISGSIPLSRSESFLTLLLAYMAHGPLEVMNPVNVLVPAGHAYPYLERFTPHFSISHANSQACFTRGRKVGVAFLTKI